MKKITLTFAMMSFAWATFLSAQSLQVTHLDSVVMGNAHHAGDIEGISVVKNISSDTLEVRFRRIDGNYNALTDSNAICWGLCFTTNISVSPLSFTKSMAPGARDTAITHVYPDKDGVGRTGSITYVYFVENSPTDSVAYSVRYEVTPDLSTRELMPEKRTSLEVFPNPATQGNAQLDYELANTTTAATFEMLNLVGEVVLRRSLEAKEGQLRLDLRGLAPGVYYYTLKQEGKSLSTRKLVIR